MLATAPARPHSTKRYPPRGPDLCGGQHQLGTLSAPAGNSTARDLDGSSQPPTLMSRSPHTVGALTDSGRMSTAIDTTNDEATAFAKDAARGLISSVEREQLSPSRSVHAVRGCGSSDFYVRQLRAVMVMRCETVHDLPDRPGASTDAWIDYAKQILSERP